MYQTYMEGMGSSRYFSKVGGAAKN
jgi:hypothetical protein